MTIVKVFRRTSELLPVMGLTECHELNVFTKTIAWFGVYSNV